MENNEDLSKVAKLYVTSPGLPPFEEFVEEIRSLWDSKILTHQGPKYKKLEREIQDFLDVSHAPLFANGHLALQVLLRAYGWSDGEVITTPFTFASTTMAILECGLTPVFCDIDPVSLCIDPHKIEALITPKTRAILGVHVYGVPCDVDSIHRIAEKHDLIVIYDAAHAFGERINGKSIACYGDASMFSFHATKVYNTVEGGALAFEDDGFYEKICDIRQFGASSEGRPVNSIGTNAKMTEMHAAMGLCNLRHFTDHIRRRRSVFEEYEKRFNGQTCFSTINYPSNLEPNYAYYPIVINESSGVSRDDLADELIQNGIYARKYFFPLTSDFAIVKKMFNTNPTPIAARIANSVLCLPLHPNMTTEEAKHVADLILNRLN